MSSLVQAAPAARGAVPPPPLPRSAWCWAAFEGFRNPGVVLITIYVFMPYYVQAVAATPVEGQALVARAGQIAGWAVALTAPLMGMVVDRLGPRKPGLTLVVAGMIPLFWALWFVTPGGPVTPAMVMAIIVGKSILFAWSEVLHNALLVPAAHGQVSRTSGLGLALGNATSVAFLLFVLLAFSLPGQVDWPFVPAQPLFGVDQAAYEPARLTGPIVAVSLAIGLALILWGVPDAPATGERLGSALKKGFADLTAMLRELKTEREAAKFLAARMLYVDGKTAILLFSGVLAAGTMGWKTLEMLAYGIILSILAVAGGLLAGRLDSRLGPRNAVLLEIAVTAVALLCLLGTRPDMAGWIPVSTLPLHDGPMFRTPAELAFIGFAGVSAISITAAYASSRTLLTVLVRPERAGTFFGLYALSGTATMWLGPMLVAWGTIASGSQQGGFATVLALLLAGFALLLTVKVPRHH
ncbi:MFS transporter [Sandaracinobacter neustonicus]|uniref:MFS transporter n=1 Tax=Sandaracinobacter neustonicus TaxID=1715348 RepID=UPI001F2F92A4|nr:MFS transporter [Sandaracinobacter neustonicus]